MDALDILARIDGGQPATGQEFGYLLPELERRGHIKVERVERHCKRSSRAHTAIEAGSFFGSAGISATIKLGSRRSWQRPAKYHRV